MEVKSFIYLALAGIIACTACGKNEGSNASPEKKEPTNASGQNGTAINSDTILNITYETGALNGGLADIVATKATASDAASLVSPGRSGNYAISHKVTLGDAGYYSNEAYRSEADAININEALFFPGQERRYEFSLYLKDWQQWNSANPPYGDNIFQLKVSGGDPVPVRLLTKRHAITVRYDATGNGIVIADFRPQINKWVDFRIDVKWTLDNTGYFKIYTKYQGEQDFTLRFQNLNARTFTGTQLSNGQKGYIKWGVYREAGEDSNGNVLLTDNVLTRIAYHDNIRIVKLN
ncbi:heparin lyase I family protein [Pedobacter nanyangensis]|uniref:heparin lyase I family protein n=1 Tax=Pedobacter nanyangensis TaxID=1562389 RepID=UPI000DE4491A|nr:heparin lyase I family protein [Pedobacter nanyangensis]